jgi:hypothetical protein
MNMSQLVQLESGDFVRLARRERSGWRDLGWSLRQRCYGYDAPHCDGDSIVYENRKPLAMFEDVSEYGRLKSPKDDPNIAALNRLANGQRGDIPFFGRRYATDYSWISLHPINKAASSFTPSPAVGFGNRMSELNYVIWRYMIANRRITTKDAENIITASIRAEIDKPLRRSLILTDLDNKDTIERDINSLTTSDAVNLLKTLANKLVKDATAIIQLRQIVNTLTAFFAKQP